MCGRFALDGTIEEFNKRFRVQIGPSLFSPQKNITPGSMIPIIKEDQGPKAILAKWGLVPSWAKDPKIGYKMINARRETLMEKPSFRKPFLSTRCLIPSNGFYEWLHTEKEKIPYYYRLTSGELFAFAGLYDVWKDAEGFPLVSCTIITTTPNSLITPVHNRMPVILTRGNEEIWLNGNVREPEALLPMLVPFDPKKMETYPVSFDIKTTKDSAD